MAQATDEGSQQERLAGQATAAVQDAASVAQEKVSELREQGSARLRDQFDERSSRAGAQVRSLADALRRSSDDLGTQGNGTSVQLTGQAADRIERVGTYLEQKSGDELMRDIEAFARRRPWMLAGLGMLAGVAAARFLKASSEQRYGNYRTEWPSRKGVEPPAVGQSYQGSPGSDYFAGEAGPGDSSAAGAVNDPLNRDPYAGAR